MHDTPGGAEGDGDMTTRGPIDDDSRTRCGAVRSPTAHSARTPARRTAPGPGIVEQLRQAAIYVETASVLEQRAHRSDNPALAALLRERADARRRTAARLRAALAAQVGTPPTRRTAGWG
jgi:hypothetical protein